MGLGGGGQWRRNGIASSSRPAVGCSRYGGRMKNRLILVHFFCYTLKPISLTTLQKKPKKAHLEYTFQIHYKNFFFSVLLTNLFLSYHFSLLFYMFFLHSVFVRLPRYFFYCCLYNIQMMSHNIFLVLYTRCMRYS